METTFKGYEAEQIMEAASYGLKVVLEQKLCSKLDGRLNTEEAHIVDMNTTIYNIKGLYQGFVGGHDLEKALFVVFEGKSIGLVEESYI